ncbi:hypothetical protein CIB48_g824 [Xylaria polymorpha]|nr:hypothetical protein CIB48_g824 [Xylaria polymorpha]
MFTIKTLGIFLMAAAVPLAAASPVNDTVVDAAAAADFWAQFCNDDNCSEGCGESVRVSNPGCLNEGGRKSIRFHGSDVGNGDYALVVSSGANCPCQNTCASVPSGSLCWGISDYSGDQSFRFISGHCASNNC